MKPWQTIARARTAAGPLELRQRGEQDFLIVIDGRVLMTSVAHASEDELARLACAPLKDHKRPRVLIGGLGMGYTLRAALDQLPATAEVRVVDLNPDVIAWCRGPLAALSTRAVDDARVTVEVADVASVIARARNYDAIVLDLYEGPKPANNRRHDPLYGAAALKNAAAALAPGGILAVWSEDADPTFETRLGAAGFTAAVVRVRRGGRSHVVYTGHRR